MTSPVNETTKRSHARGAYDRILNYLVRTSFLLTINGYDREKPHQIADSESNRQPAETTGHQMQSREYAAAPA